MADLKPPVLIVDFHFCGRRDEFGVVFLRRKQGSVNELAPYISQVLDLQQIELLDGMKVWLADLDRDISGINGSPLAATVRWSDTDGWYAEYLWDEAESLE